MKKIILLLLIGSAIFAQQGVIYYGDSLTPIVYIADTLTTDTTDYTDNLLRGDGVKPDRIFIHATIADDTLKTHPTELAPTNTATIDVYGYSGGFWHFIVRWDGTADWGSWNKYIDNHCFTRLRFITSDNTGWVRVSLQLMRVR